MQGLMWRATNDDGSLTYSFIEALNATYPYYAVRLLGGADGARRHVPHGLQRAGRPSPAQSRVPSTPRFRSRHERTRHSVTKPSRRKSPGSACWIAVVISIGGLVEIVPLYLSNEVTTPAPGVKPYDALALEGRDIYVREGCYNCHSQMIRPLRAETERYGHYSLAGESVYDHPFQFGSKRTGPDLARVGGRYSDEWHRAHLMNPRDVVPESNMPAYPVAGGSARRRGRHGREDARAAQGRRAVHRRRHRGRRGRRARQDRDGCADRLSAGPRHGLGELVSSDGHQTRFAASSPASCWCCSSGWSIWAWSKARRADFDAAARLPLEDGRDPRRR